MNYQTIQNHLENAHALLIETGEDLDLHELGSFPAAMSRKDWRGAAAILEECGASSSCGPQFWRALLLAVRELEMPRYVARIEKRLENEGL